MRRYVVNYAGAWLTGFERRKFRHPIFTSGSFSTAVDFTYVPTWGEFESRRDYKELAFSIADVIRRGGIDCEVFSVMDDPT